MVSVIPKERKRKVKFSSDRPISIPNIDYTLYTTIFAKGLDRILPLLIHNDQPGCVTQRQTRDNIKRSLHTLHHIQQNNISAYWILLAAFDSVSSPFLDKVLEMFGTDHIFIKGHRLE